MAGYKCSCGKANCRCGGKGSKVTKGKYAAGGLVSTTKPATKTATLSTASLTSRPTMSAYKAPTYSAFSAKGLTSSDPANVARNRAAAARYSSMNTGGGNSDRDIGLDKLGLKPPVQKSVSAPKGPVNPYVAKWLGPNPPKMTNANIPFVRRRRASEGDE